MKKKNSVLTILIILVGFNILAWVLVYNLSQPKFLEVTFFSIGQGDSIFIETPENHQILIDGGPSSVVLAKVAEEMPFYDRTIDLIILSHPENDHIAGLIEVLKRYKVENILWTGVLRDTAEFKEWQRLIKEEGSNIFIAKVNQTISFSEVGENQVQKLEVLWPIEDINGKEVKNTNNTSIVLKLVFNDNTFLFTGDIAKSVEREIVEKNIDSDVLKVSHHGSKTSTAEEFIISVSPKIAVIQCGKDNPYGHPRSETLEILKKYDIKTFRTDLDGDIKIISNGKTYAVSSLQN